MSWSKLTLIGMTNYIDSLGGDLFASLSLPEGIEKDILCNTILSRGGEFEVIYSDPEFMASQIGYWSRRCYRTFDKWITTLNIEYDPLYNYDRHESWTDGHNYTKNLTGSYSFIGSIARVGGSQDTNDLTMTNDLTRTDDLTHTTKFSHETENTRSAMDASTYQPYTKQTDKTLGDGDTLEDDGTVKNTGTVKDTGSVTRTDHDTTGTINDETKADKEILTESSDHTAHIYGNIGVTTSQQMLAAELDVARWNIYDKITDLFLQEFVIPIYE